MEDDPFDGLMTPWQNAQRPMTAVVRWGNFPNYRQTLTEHNNSIPCVAMWVQSKLGHRSEIDWLLLMQAIAVHDQGEPRSGGDEHAANKTADKDLKEYLAVSEMMVGSDPAFRRLFMRAFLLQYVRKPQWWTHMNNEDQATMTVLVAKYSREALLFDAIERLDYLASGVEAFGRGIQNETETMIDHVLGNQVSKLDALVGEWAPLAGVWTPDRRQRFLSLGSK